MLPERKSLFVLNNLLWPIKPPLQSFTYNVIQISIHPVFVASYDFAPKVDHYDTIVFFLHKINHAGDE